MKPIDALIKELKDMSNGDKTAEKLILENILRTYYLLSLISVLTLEELKQLGEEYELEGNSSETISPVSE